MTGAQAVAISAPSRLHFGLLSWGDRGGREFGGLGLTVRDPGTRVLARRSEHWGAEGPLADRALEAALAVAADLGLDPDMGPALRLRVEQAAPPHVGLGSGTQAALAGARLAHHLLAHRETPAPTIADLARLTGRGRRSGVGLHAFAEGGLVVDGGGRPGAAPPLVARMVWPDDWLIAVLIPNVAPGLHGPTEVAAFDTLPPPPGTLTDRLCRLVLLDLLPAVADHDLDGFGAALEEIQRRVGEAFAPAQGGPYAGPEVARALDLLRRSGLKGVGQSSWGPAVYGFADDRADAAVAVVERARNEFGLGPDRAFRTRAVNHGARLLPHGGDAP